MNLKYTLLTEFKKIHCTEGSSSKFDLKASHDRSIKLTWMKESSKITLMCLSMTNLKVFSNTSVYFIDLNNITAGAATLISSSQGSMIWFKS